MATKTAKAKAGRKPLAAGQDVEKESTAALKAQPASATPEAAREDSSASEPKKQTISVKARTEEADKSATESTVSVRAKATPRKKTLPKAKAAPVKAIGLAKENPAKDSRDKKESKGETTDLHVQNISSEEAASTSDGLFSLFSAVNDGFLRLWSQGASETVKLAEKAARAGSLNDLFELQIDYTCALSQGCVEEGLRISECAFAAVNAANREIITSGQQ